MRNFLAWLSIERNGEASPKTGAYCRARARLPLKEIEGLHEALAERLKGTSIEKACWRGRKVKVIDGSSVSMPDSPENQARYPQPSTQKRGCGFPVMRIVAAFSLGSGTLLTLAKGALAAHERILFHLLWDSFDVGDVVLADRGFCSYADFYCLSQRGVDSVMRNNQRRKAGVEEVKRLGKGERLIHWKKTKVCPKWLDREQWQNMPDTLLVREATITIDVPGFRSETIVVVTTLLDHKEYPQDALAELYRRRWMAELYLRDIKISLGMDVLRCKTPDMVEKELWMHIIAYNLIRSIMCQAADAHGVDSQRISFKGTTATVRQWAPLMATVENDTGQHERMLTVMLKCIARDPVPLRPNRIEPRAIKRRPKNHQLMTKPRPEFKEAPHRSRYKKSKTPHL